jgi:phosphomevalonate kinase
MPIAVSAPGKVLLAGGYLVLDKNYSGLVFGLNARIHTISTLSTPEEGRIVIKSPQFSNAVWTYEVSGGGGKDKGVSVTHLPDERFPSSPPPSTIGLTSTNVTSSSNNPFVETTIRYVLSYLSLSEISSSSITILADNDYYSQPQSTRPPCRFNNLNVPLNSAHKTGLGSSAALVTSLTACLLSTYSPSSSSPLNLTTPWVRRTVHNLSQAAHCAAQGKVGSGFDVAAAVFGSCIYRRFSPSILESVGEAGAPGFAQRLRAAVDKEWDLKIEKTRVPEGVRVIMGDVDCGSSTPGMVKKVLKWRDEQRNDADALWGVLEGLNTGLIKLLGGLGDGGLGDATRVERVKQQIKDIRESITKMGQAAGVPIEPEEQKKLLDAVCENVDGVLGGIVPGAGGYDAVAFLAIDDDRTVNDLKQFLGKWGGGGKVRVLETREEQDGVRFETVEEYEGYGNYLKLN